MESGKPSSVRSWIKHQGATGMRLSLRTELPQWIIITAMFVAAAVVRPTAPDRLAIHWNIQGQADGCGGKFEGLLLMPLIALGTYLLLAFLPCFDSRAGNYARFAKVYGLIRGSVLVVLALVQAATLLWIKGIEFNMSIAISLIVSVLFVVVGYVMPRIQPTWFVGIRAPWTLTSERSWRKTHELGRWVFIEIGIAAITEGLTGSTAAICLMLGLLFGGVLLLGAYSYIIWRQDHGHRSPMA
jgi:uncharacterized membrane protein